MRTLIIAAVVCLEVIRRKEAYVLLILLGALVVAVASLDIFGLGGVGRYVKDVSLLAAWIFSWILAVNISSRQLPDEERRGTVFQVLSKPVKRTQFIAGKWLGAWLTVCAAALAFYILAAVLVKLKGAELGAAATLQGYLLHCSALTVICAIGILFATRMNKDAAATLTYALTASSFLIVPRIPAFLADATGIRATMLFILYNLLPHFEVFDMRKRIVHDYGPVSATVFFQIVLYGIALALAVLLLACLSYRSKKFSRTTIH